MQQIEVLFRKGEYGLAYIDDEDYDLVSQYKWYTLRTHGKGVTAVVARPTIDGKQRTVYMHRLILGLKDRSIHVDHIDRNPLNNQKSNLRTCTIAENNFNRVRQREHHNIPYKGVYIRDKRKNMSKPYQVKIGFKGLRLTIDKSYESMEEAAKVYDELAKVLHGEFASLNFPD